MIRAMTAAVVLAVCMAPAAFAAPLQVAAFHALPEAQQLEILDASYNAVVAELAFTQADVKGSSAAKQLFSCVRDRNAEWVQQALDDYLNALQGTPTSLGGAVTQALAWRCGVLTVETQG